jgi:SAM-dependent methyltransferase
VGLDDLVHDAIPVNQPYAGLVAQAYDVWMPPSGDDPDVEVYRKWIERGAGPALELGCGNGRLLVGYAREGFDVEGVDSSADMLAICAAHGREAGLDLTLHHADWLALDLGRTYATIYNPAGSFALIAGDDDARIALAAWRRHLRPGGQLMIAMSVPTAGLDVQDAPDAQGAQYEWRVRRSGTRPSDGVTFMVHEAVRIDAEAQTEHILNRHELWSASGELITTFLRRYRLRWWTPGQLEGMFRTCDYVDVRSRGESAAFITFGRSL